MASITQLPRALKADLRQALVGPLFPEFDKFELQFLADRQRDRTNADYSRPGVRLSNFGKEPIGVAYIHLGIDPYRKSDDLEPWVLEGGHAYERDAKARIASALADKLTILPSVGPVEYRGIKGHSDAVIQTNALGKRYVLEFKHVSDSVLRKLLCPELQINPITGNDNRTGRFIETFDPCALDNDDRGYITQLCSYIAAHDADGGAFVLFDKGNRKTYIVSIPQWLYKSALSRADKTLAALTHVKTVDDIYTYFTAPDLIPQVSKKVPTGVHYLPDSVRYFEWDILDDLYIEDPNWDGFDLAYQYLEVRPLESRLLCC